MKASLGAKNVPFITRKGKQQMYITFIIIDGMEGNSMVNEIAIKAWKPDNTNEFYDAMIADINKGNLVPYRKYQDTPFYHSQMKDYNGMYCQIQLHNKLTNTDTYEYNY